MIQVFYFFIIAASWSQKSRATYYKRARNSHKSPSFHHKFKNKYFTFHKHQKSIKSNKFAHTNDLHTLNNDMNEIMDVDLRLPYKRSWYFGRKRKYSSDDLTKGIKDAYKKIDTQRKQQQMEQGEMQAGALEIVKHFDTMIEKYLDKKVKQRDHETLMKDSMEEALTYALSVINQRKEIQKAAKQIEQQQKKEYQRKLKEYEEETKFKKDLQKQQLQMQKDLQSKQIDMMKKQMDSQTQMLKPKKKFLGIF
ncbi:hypothetical protein TRFO_22498 [Tritrichomonas foetus]|uniref:Uncharacterized protein n=1 Tax=Tritrichomonas foetus TaxID=1144522 RepID=A0A1J4KD26_9EUKA|nr:hypothetical protein TRFO_22498 [Tritrichomonas foetus]|eukprot:OHT08840.1 hypothetical protein TRFO_22498 [Tritrichomonas foetus]